MKELFLALAFCSASTGSKSCGSADPVTPTPISVGGSSSIGGTATAAGGTEAKTTIPAAGGWLSIGGATTKTTIAALHCPVTMKGAPIVRHPLKWRHSGAMRAKPRASYVILATTASVEWPLRLAHHLDQGSEGACTGFGVAHCVSSGDFLNRLTNADGRRAYYRATELDDFKGTAPAVDTGSDGKSALRAAVEFGWINGFYSPQTFEDVQIALGRGPCVFGSNWHTGMFTPDASCQLHLTGVVEGGHEYSINVLDADRKLIGLDNSWGDEFGDHGRATLSFGDFVKLMPSGEVDCPNPPH